MTGVQTCALPIWAKRRDGVAVLEVVDDGLGMSEERLVGALGRGIGLANVNERLRIIYGASCELKLSSQTGRGTCVTIEIPELMVADRATA